MDLATAVTEHPATEHTDGVHANKVQVFDVPAPLVEPEAPPIAPVTGQDRLVALDTLRGVAVLGILLMNILFFGLPMAAGFNPSAMGEATFLNRATWVINQILFEGKMRTIFSMCFGGGVILLTSRAEKRGRQADIADVYYRRLLWLILFGLLHAYFLWAGDILYSYGIVGLFLYPFRKLRPWALITIGVFLLICSMPMSVIKAVMIYKMPSKVEKLEEKKQGGEALSDDEKTLLQGWQQAQRFIHPKEEDFKKEIETHRGGYWGLFGFRARLVVMMESSKLYRSTFFDVAGMMFIGMALMKMGVFAAERSIRFYTIMAIIGYGIGCTLTLIPAVQAILSNFNLLDFLSSYLTTYQFGRLFVALGHIAAIMLIYKKGALPRIRAALAAVGQMAFTNYILATVICVLLFEGFGFGWFGELERYQLYFVVFGVWAVQIALSLVWLRFFRFGPLEWVWRALTYWQLPRLLKRTGEPVLASA